MVFEVHHTNKAPTLSILKDVFDCQLGKKSEKERKILPYLVLTTRRKILIISFHGS